MNSFCSMANVHEGRIFVDEGDVVVVAPALEDLLASESGLEIPLAPLAQVVAVVVVLAEAPLVPAVLDVAEELDPEPVGVQGPGLHPHRARVVIRIVDDLRIAQRLLGHDRGVPVGVVVQEPAGSVAVGLLDRDVVDVVDSGGELDDLVLPALLLEPFALGDISLERGLLAGQAKADALGEELGGGAGHVDVEAAIGVAPAAAQNPVIQQQQLGLLGELIADRREDDPLRAGVPVAVEVGAQERADHWLG